MRIVQNLICLSHTITGSDCFFYEKLFKFLASFLKRNIKYQV